MYGNGNLKEGLYMKTRRIKRWVKVLLVIVGVIVLVDLLNNISKSNKEYEKEMVQTYVTCLENNWTQRDYCAKQQNSNYYYMDSLIGKYGYSYKQVGYDLYVVREGNEK